MKEYTDILGSEEAAYYVLSQNNGFPLEYTPQGQPSLLYNDLKNAYLTDEEAVRRKAMTYTQAFLLKYGDWTTDPNNVSDPNLLDSQGEPLLSLIDPKTDIDDLMNNLYLRNDDQLTTTYEDLFNINPVDPNSDYIIETILKQTRLDYVNNKIKEAKNNDPNITEDEIQNIIIRSTREWQSIKAKSILTEESKVLCSAFGLVFKTNTNGFVELVTPVDDNDEKQVTNLRIKFVESLTQDPLEDEWRPLLGQNKLNKEYSEKMDGAASYINNAVSINREIDHAYASSTLIFLSLNRSSAQTLSKTLAHHYIVSMLDSPLILESLRTFDDPNNPKSTLYLINKLVNAITDASVCGIETSSLLNKALRNEKLMKDQQEKLKFFYNFWNEFDDLKEKVITNGIVNKKHLQKLLSVVCAAIALNEQVEVFNAGLYNSNYVLSNEERMANWYAVKYSPLLDAQRQFSEGELLFNSLLTAYENKIKRFERKNDDNYGLLIIELLLNLDKLKKNDPDNIQDQMDIITDLINLGTKEVNDALLSVPKLNDPSIDIKRRASFLATIYDETVSFYSSLLQKELNFVIIDPKFSNIKPSYDVLNQKLNDLQTFYKSNLYNLTCDLVDNYIDTNLNDGLLTPQETINYKRNCHLWLKNQSQNGDISSFETLLQMASLSESPIISIVSNALSRINSLVENKTNEVAQDLAKELSKAKLHLKTHSFSGLLNELTPGSFLVLFLEKDPNTGKPTGLFTRKRNYGVFYKLRDSKINELVKNIEYKIRNKTGNVYFKLELDSNNNPIFPEGDEYDEYWREYNIELNSFECKYANKRFTEEYYRLRFEKLSRKTVKLLDDIQEKIDAIQRPITEKGVPHVERLPLENLNELWELWNEQEQLANRYNEDGVLKSGDYLKAAEEIKLFRKEIQDRRKFVTDWNKYDLVLNGITDQQLKNVFEAYTKHKIINPTFFLVYHEVQKRYMSQFPSNFDSIFEEISKLTDEKNDIVNVFKNKGFYLPDLEKLSDEAWRRIKELEEQIMALYEPILQWKWANKDRLQFSSAALTMASFKDIMYNNSNVTLYDYFIALAMNEDLRELQQTGQPTSHNYLEAIDKYTIIRMTPHGAVREPLGVFKYFNPERIPSDMAIKYNINPGFKFIIDQPLPCFNKLLTDDSEYPNTNPLVNKEFDPTEDSYIQPKQLNPDFNRILKLGLMPLYDKLIHYMLEANENIPDIGTQSRYRLPQQRAETFALWSRTLRNGPKKTFKYIWDSTFNVNENDDYINDDFTTLPDGTRINNVPLRYIRPLENPEYLTQNVVGSVLCYYEMATNYAEKVKMQPVISSILLLISLETIRKDDLGNNHSIFGINTEQYKKLKNVINYLLFDQADLLGKRDNKKMTSKEKKTIKRLNLLSNVGISLALARNKLSQGTGFIDAFQKFISFSITGESFNVFDMLFSFGKMTEYAVSGKLLYELGNNSARTKGALLMRKNNLSSNPVERLRDSHKSRARRVLSSIFNKMVGFRLSDYLINLHFTFAIYHNYRYLDVDKNKPMFLQKPEFIKICMRDYGMTRKQARRKYRKADTLYKAYSTKGNKLSIKDSYNLSNTQIKKLEENVRTLLKTWISKSNGNIPNEEKGTSMLHVALAFATKLRTYLINEIATRFFKSDDLQNSNVSRRNIDKLKIKRKSLLRTLAKNMSDKKKAKELKKIDELIIHLVDELNKLSNSGLIYKKTINTDFVKKFAQSVIVGSSIGTYGGFIIGSPVFGSILGGLGGGAYYMANKNALKSSESYLMQTLISKIENKLIELEAKRDAIYSQIDNDEIQSLISELDGQIEEMERSLHDNKGKVDWNRQRITYGYNRAWGSALLTRLKQLNWIRKWMLRPDFRNLKDNFCPKLSEIERRGLRKINADITILMIMFSISTFLYCWYKADNADKWLDNIMPDVALQYATERMHDMDEALSNMIEPVVNSDLFEQVVTTIHDKSVDLKDNIPDVPGSSLLSFFPTAAERLTDDMLGKSKKVKRADGSVHEVKKDRVLSALLKTKANAAAFSMRASNEGLAPYDVLTVNDVVSAVSANFSVFLRSIENQLNLLKCAMDGQLEDFMQAGPYNAYFDRGEYFQAKSPILRYTGFPTAYEQSVIEGLDNRIEFQRKLGGSNFVYPSFTNLDKTKQKDKKKKMTKPTITPLIK